MCTKHIFPYSDFGVDEGQSGDSHRAYVSESYGRFFFHQFYTAVTEIQQQAAYNLSSVFNPFHYNVYINKPSPVDVISQQGIMSVTEMPHIWLMFKLGRQGPST
jgi:hypothetical protein